MKSSITYHSWEWTDESRLVGRLRAETRPGSTEVNRGNRGKTAYKKSEHDWNFVRHPLY